MSNIVSRLKHTGRRRMAALSTAVALSVLLLVPSIAAAAPTARVQLKGDTLVARVVGGARTGAWRVRIVAPGGRERVDIVLRSGDITWNAVVRTSRRTADGWSVVARKHVPGTFDGLRRVTGTAAGVRWDSASFRLPQDGDSRFVVRVELLRDGSYRTVSSVRSSIEAFTYGPWQRLDTELVDH